MPFRIGSLKTLNYESRLDNMTDEGHLRPFYDTSKIRNTPFEAVRTIRVTPQNGDPVINHNLDVQGPLVLNRGEYLLETVVSDDAVFTVQFTMWGAGGTGGSQAGGVGGGAGYTCWRFEVTVSSTVLYLRWWRWRSQSICISHCWWRVWWCPWWSVW